MCEASRLRLELPLIGPGGPDLEDRCVGRLTSTLAGRPGAAHDSHS